MTDDWKAKITFPERSIARYAKYVDPEKLEIGRSYFRLQYIGDELQLPELVPLIFIGKDLDPSEDVSRLYFQDASSYSIGVRWGDPPAACDGETEEERFQQFLARGHFETYEASQLSVLDFESALNLLLLYSLAHQNPAPN
jgi:hypothetical protein